MHRFSLYVTPQGKSWEHILEAKKKGAAGSARRAQVAE